MIDRIWKFFCSLELAIVLASTATILAISGSLVMHFNPRIYENLESQPLGRWMAQTLPGHIELTWWFPLFAILLMLLGINTLCCFFDWVFKIRSRWRKTGEYLIHLGFVLVLGAFTWGSIAGIRIPAQPVMVGQKIPVPGLEGHFLRLDDFSPLPAPSGRPMDMMNKVTLLKGEDPLTEMTLKTNNPLTYKGLVVIPSSYGQSPTGFRVMIQGIGVVNLTPGAEIELGAKGHLSITNFFPNASFSGTGSVISRGGGLINPALQVTWTPPDDPVWQGWYFIRKAPPQALTNAGISFRPLEPYFQLHSLLTLNYDPGASLALIGGCSMLLGVMVSMVSFYRKRLAGDRPEAA